VIPMVWNRISENADTRDSFVLGHRKTPPQPVIIESRSRFINSSSMHVSSNSGCKDGIWAICSWILTPPVEIVVGAVKDAVT